MTLSDDNLVPWVVSIIERYVDEAATNTLNLPSAEKAWDKPLVGFANGADPLFRSIREDIGPFYWTPAQIFRLSHPTHTFQPEELSVISYVLPQTGPTREGQSKETTYPAMRWARSRYYGEIFNCELRQHLAASLTDAGFPAIAPERSPLFDYRQSEKVGIASNWSERHTAFVAGLGTFGLSDGLITPAGKAVRIGSVVAKIPLPATPRPYQSHQEYCLWFSKGTCGACIKRCPAEAITANGHDKSHCHAYIREVTAPYAQQQFQVQATPCGLCQVKIPCEKRIPTQTNASDNTKSS